jgi:hypothetical protein
MPSGAELFAYFILNMQGKVSRNIYPTVHCSELDHLLNWFNFMIHKLYENEDKLKEAATM